MSSERILTAAIMRDRWERNFVLPNFTPPGWWECDVFEVTKSGYFREYEVKLTLADFRRDRDKAQVRGAYEFGKPRSSVLKRDMLAAGDVAGPVEFYYVTPAGLLDGVELPKWAGWLQAYENGAGHWRVMSQPKAEAPRLHRETASAKVTAYARETCYWRMHRLMKGLAATLTVSA